MECVPDTYILGIESSCDETAAAVVRSGEELISNVVYSQIATHQPYGGVVPELASREHLRAIVPVVRKALEDAGKTYETHRCHRRHPRPRTRRRAAGRTQLRQGAGLRRRTSRSSPSTISRDTSTLCCWKSARTANTTLQFPVLALVVSGGHTHLYLAEQQDGSWTYRNIGHTRDDAAGEAFDKVAKLLELGYPGGPAIDFLAQHGNPHAVKFPFAQIKHRDRNPQNRHAA